MLILLLGLLRGESAALTVPVALIFLKVALLSRVGLSSLSSISINTLSHNR